MLHGDLSNKTAPAIVINADLLFEIKKKWLGLRYELTFLLSHRQLLERWFDQVSIYIVCMGEYGKRAAEIQDLLETFMVPYTRVQAVATASELHYLVSSDNVLGYFFQEETMVDFRTDKRKHIQVPNVSEIDYMLGVRA